MVTGGVTSNVFGPQSTNKSYSNIAEVPISKRTSDLDDVDFLKANVHVMSIVCVCVSVCCHRRWRVATIYYSLLIRNST
jgi:hypothetical protein